jgi:hypothetical protein
MFNLVLNPKLAHLTNEQVDELIREYYSKKKPISNLIQRFNVDCLPAQLYTLFPPEISSAPCPNCGSNMLRRRLSKSANRIKPKHGLRCASCDHHEKKYCACAFCRKKRKQCTSGSSKLITQVNTSGQHHPGVSHISANDLTLEQAVSLLALMRGYGITGKQTRRSLCISKMLKAPFAPSSDYGLELLNRLVEARLLIFSSEPYPKTIFTSKSQLALSYAGQWMLSSSVSSELFNDIETRTIQCNWPSAWYEQVSELACDLALSECKEFYAFCTSERKFPDANEKIVNAMLTDLLTDFSTGQCFRIIQSGAQYAADFLVKQNTTPRHAANYMVGACQRWADKARSNAWSVTNFRRNFNCPRSIMSYVLHDFFLNARDEGLNTPMGLIVLPTRLK